LRLICPNLEVIYHYAHVLENIAALTASDAYLGSCSLVKQMEVYQLYEDAVTYVQSQPGQDPA